MAFKNLTQLFDYFKDEATCKEYLEQQRWNGSPECPFCGCTKVYRTNRGFRCGDKFCDKKFSVTVGTVYENTKIGLRTWFAAIYLATSSKKGISSLQLSRQLGITQKTAWFVLHRVREMLRDKAPVMLKGTIEVDETFVGGKNRNKHKSKRAANTQGRSVTDKTPILGIIEKGGRVQTFVVPNTTIPTIMPIVRNVVEKGSIMVTDEYAPYARLRDEYNHQVIQHRLEQYVRDGFHTNSIEGYWSILKRGIYGIYHQVSPKHLQRYCDEFAARFNTREIKDNERFELSVKNSAGRLKYNQLIGK